MNYPRLHTVTTLSSNAPDYVAYDAFRSACEGGGTPPSWTQCGPDPRNWIAPSDAAGGLVLWDEDGCVCSAEPLRDGASLAEAAEIAWDGLLSAGAIIGTVRASYASSGGRMVALCRAHGRWIITVSRTDSRPRSGVSELGILQCDQFAEVLVLGPHSRVVGQHSQEMAS